MTVKKTVTLESLIEKRLIELLNNTELTPKETAAMLTIAAAHLDKKEKRKKPTDTKFFRGT